MTKYFNKFKKPVFGPFLVHFTNFGDKKSFLENPALSHTTSYQFLAPYQNLEKTNNIILRERPDRRTDRPYFIGPFRLMPGVQKRVLFLSSYEACFQIIFLLGI